jgi:hypothetical protein
MTGVELQFALHPRCEFDTRHMFDAPARGFDGVRKALDG